MNQHKYRLFPLRRVIIHILPIGFMKLYYFIVVINFGFSDENIVIGRRYGYIFPFTGDCRADTIIVSFPERIILCVIDQRATV